MPRTAREAYNEYMREWKKKNKDKVKVWNKNYWERKAKESQSHVI